jgi:3',5'-cyclic AMP phosphodiesterase CpdA
MLTIAHLADTHLDGQPAVRDRVTRVAAYLHALPHPVDAVVVSGDVTEPYPGVSMLAEFAWIDAALGPELPVLYCPGNSDEPEAFRAFLDARADSWEAAGGQTHQVRSVGDLTFLLLDATVRGEFFGRLEPESIEWLRRTIASLDDNAQAILVMHQPPLTLGHPVVDTLRLLDAGELEAIVRASDAVIATWCGHAHAGIATTFAGKPLVVAPGVHSAGQLPLAYTDPNPGLIDESSPPALAVHIVDDGRVTTYFQPMPS